MANRTSGGPIQTGHVRKVAAPTIAKNAIGAGRTLVPDDQRPPERDREELRHHLRQERVLREGSDEVRARQQKQQHGHDRERDARRIRGNSRSAMRKTSPHLSATVNATSGYTA